MLRTFLAVWLTGLFLSATSLAAQDVATPDYTVWESRASQAEALVENPDVTDQQLTELRSELADWRKKFRTGEEVNATRIASVNEQLKALEPAPGEGETESEDIARRRAELQDLLSKLQAPQLTAVEAFSRADALIHQIDRLSDARQALELARLSPSPLRPASLAAAAKDSLQLLEGFGAEAIEIGKTSSWSNISPRLPQALAYLIAAIILLTYGRHWVRSLPSRLSVHASEYSRSVVVFVVSLGQIALPMIGVYLAINAVRATGLAGPWTTPFLDALPQAFIIFFAFGWLGRQLFPRQAIIYDTLTMDESQRNRARRMLSALSIVFAIHHVASMTLLPQSGLYGRIGDNITRVPFEVSDAFVSVGHFAILLLGALPLFRLGSTLRKLDAGKSIHGRAYRHGVLKYSGMLTRIVVAVSVLLGALGFINFANTLFWPWTLTLTLICVLVLLQDFIADVYALIKRGEEGARDGLIPLLLGFFLILLSVPLFLIIWGARSAELSEYWSAVIRGISVGGINLSPGVVLTFLIVFAIGYSITRGLQGAFRNSILPKTKLNSGGQAAVVAGIGYVGIFLAAVIAIVSAGIDLSSLAIVAGALSVGVGFGLQNIVSNFVSGIILLIERPVSVGDWISAGGQQGIVKSISVRSTQVETFDKTEVIVPNSDLISQPVVNWTRHNLTGRIIIPVRVAYGTDTRHVERVLLDIIEDQPVVTVDPAPSVLFRGFGESSLDFEIRAVLSDVSAGLGVTSEVCHIIAERFAEEGIRMPFPQQDIWLRNPEALRGDAMPETPAEPRVATPGRPRPQGSTHDPRITFDDPGEDAGEGDGGDR
ncbi:DUF3772 domain-containing protein [Paracoccus seriniphilus]|uniref:Small-conductance mechanosensitive channel n=1 Tax=Paracoccus seriniphilus TaxID=184748 RepID=A0A239PRU9_9RHOB|nr:DUF3772 domain-containing protein [Paracoccus seriniphilus]WCR12801.1 mechanosensitive ion channel family protein [Paracoccus seriniphilus]SNT72783.1 Small-conductance mechanosensitive channel [Paracoccus seriniphilus]